MSQETPPLFEPEEFKNLQYIRERMRVWAENIAKEINPHIIVDHYTEEDMIDRDGKSIGGRHDLVALRHVEFPGPHNLDYFSIQDVEKLTEEDLKDLMEEHYKRLMHTIKVNNN